MLLAWQARSSADGVDFAVIPGPPVVERVLQVAGVAEHLSVLLGQRLKPGRANDRELSAR